MPGDVIEYFYSVRSSFTYLGAARLNRLARDYGVAIRHYPIDLGAVIERFNTLNDARPADRPHAGARAYEHCPARERYTRIEYRRWSEHLGIPIQLDPKHHYGPRLLPSGVVILAQERGHDVDRLSHDILAALWRDDRNIADPAVLRELIVGAGLDADPDELIAAAASDAAQAALDANTARAAEQGVFGSPFYIYRGEPFFGQDRLFFLERALNRARAEGG